MTECEANLAVLGETLTVDQKTEFPLPDDQNVTCQDLNLRWREGPMTAFSTDFWGAG